MKVAFRVREWDDLIRVRIGDWACEVRVNVPPLANEAYAQHVREAAWYRIGHEVRRRLEEVTERINGPASREESTQ